MRDMAKIVTIKELLPIKDKDRIELASFKENAYTVIVQKGFKVGDLVAFIEADSLLPQKPQYEFLRARCFKQNLGRHLIKPMKMCGHISMGIVFGLDMLPKKKYKSGQDITDLLDIKKYEPQEEASPKKQKWYKKFLFNFVLTRPLAKIIWRIKNDNGGKGFPSWLISKTDETSLQNCTDILEKYKNSKCYTTIKMDGSSCTVLFLPTYKFGVKKELDKFAICSRNLMYLKGKDDWRELHTAIKTKEFLEFYYKEHNISLAIQGEVCGPAIQKNVYKLENLNFFVYTIKDLTNNRLLSFDEIVDVMKKWQNFCESERLHFVPVVSSNDVLEDLNLKENMDKYCRRYYKLPFIYNVNTDTGFIHEGVVIRGINNEFSFKIKDAEYQFNFNKDE